MNKKRYIIGIDEGTTSVRAGVFDTRLNKIIFQAQQPLSLFYPHLGWVELDAWQIWERTKFVLNQCVKKSKISPSEIYGIGITNQRETVVAWNKENGKPICRAICWQCRRTSQQIEKLNEQQKQTIKQKSGLIPDAYFSATKMKWILDNIPTAKTLLKQNKLCLGTIDSYLIFMLSKGEVFATDTTNASRTMLMNLESLKYDEDLLKMFNIDISCLPEIKECAEKVAMTDILGENVDICGIAGDQQSALFGQVCFEKGMLKNTYGTGGFLLVNTGKKAVMAKNLLSTVAFTVQGKTYYALEGSVFNCGSTVQWIRDNLNLISNSAQTEKMAYSVQDNGGVYIVPAFTGLGAPYWDSTARGLIIGLTRATKKEHIARAVLEAMAYSTQSLIDEMKNEGIKITQIKADGGASENKFLMQFQSNLSGVEIVMPKSAECTLLGAIYLAGLGCGFYNNLEDVSKSWKKQKIYIPTNTKQLKNQYKIWQKAVQKCLKWGD